MNSNLLLFWSSSSGTKQKRFKNPKRCGRIKLLPPNILQHLKFKVCLAAYIVLSKT